MGARTGGIGPRWREAAQATGWPGQRAQAPPRHTRLSDTMQPPPNQNKRGVCSVFLRVAIVLGRKPSSNLRRICSGRAMATSLSAGSAPRRERRLFDRGHHLSGYPGKGLNFSFQGERLRREFPVLDGVPIASRSPTTGPVHPEPPARGTVARSASIWRSISTPGA
jgi:hypothetical protein